MEENKLYRWVTIDEREPTEEGKYIVKMSVGSISAKIQVMESTFIKKTNSRSYWSGAMDWNYVVAWQEEYTPPTPLELEQLEIKIGECLADYDENRMCGSTNTEAAMIFIKKLKPLISSMLQEKDTERKKAVEGLARKLLEVTHELGEKIQDYAELKAQLQQKEEEPG